MRTTVKSCVVALLLVTFVILSSQAFATSVRGQVVGRNPFAPYPYPLPGVSVEIYMTGQFGWQLIYRFITGPDGMYYIPNIAPGSYTIQINGRLNYPLFVGNQPSQDVPPILVMY